MPEILNNLIGNIKRQFRRLRTMSLSNNLHKQVHPAELFFTPGPQDSAIAVAMCCYLDPASSGNPVSARVSILSAIARSEARAHCPPKSRQLLRKPSPNCIAGLERAGLCAAQTRPKSVTFADQQRVSLRHAAPSS
jgi:hypothetical protein